MRGNGELAKIMNHDLLLDSSPTELPPAEDEVLRWGFRAACYGEDPEIFFNNGEKSNMEKDRIAAAKAICGRCSVRAECQVYALEHKDVQGIWGGMTEDERRTLRLRRR